MGFSYCRLTHMIKGSYKSFFGLRSKPKVPVKPKYESFEIISPKYIYFEAIEQDSTEQGNNIESDCSHPNSKKLSKNATQLKDDAKKTD